MSTISLCMIVKDEEEVLERCLNSVKPCVDEIIIVDTGSKDKTKQIALKYTNKVFDYNWNNNFSDARNYSISKANCDYIMWLDADDIVPLKTAKKIIELKSNLTADFYMFKYDISFINNKPVFSYYRERIMKNCAYAQFNGAVHEAVTPFGKIERINYSIKHSKIKKIEDKSRNLKIYQTLLKTRELNPREQYYYARELFDHKKYKKAITILNKFIKNNNGWLENVIDAHFIIAECYNALNQNKKALNYLFKSFNYDKPRANFCCLIGDYFFINKDYQTAIYWYNTALKCEDVSYKGAFVQSYYYNYYPYLQLSCCYYYLNNLTNAIFYNEMASKVNNNQIVENNRKFYKNLIK